MRAEFEVYRKDVEVETRSGTKNYKLLPLGGDYFPILMSVIGKFPQGEDSTTEELLAALDEDTTGKIHKLVFITLKQSLNVVDKKDLEELDLFVSQNLFAFLPSLLSVNLGDNGI